MREVVTVQAGQCGNQLGSRFWEKLLTEHASLNPSGAYDSPLASHFTNVDIRISPSGLLPLGDGTAPIASLRARAVVVDMETGVTNAMLKGPLGSLFDARSTVTDVSGSGNNWAQGNASYGPEHRESLLDAVRHQAEDCDALEGFMLLHSLSGGTGSGIGTYILAMLQDEYPSTTRITTSVFPSALDDVVTSPYNALLALAELAQHADLVVPVENQALLNICCKVDEQSRFQTARGSTPFPGCNKRNSNPFDSMNSIVGDLLLGLTAGSRFGAPHGLGFSDLARSLAPRPLLHFVLPSMSPLSAPRHATRMADPQRGLSDAFLEAFQPANQLLSGSPRQSTYSACGLLVRGTGVLPSDVSRHMTRAQGRMRMASWQGGLGFEPVVGITPYPPRGAPLSLLSLGNNSCLKSTFSAMQERFAMLYKRKCYLHHYLDFMELSGITDAIETVRTLTDGYAALDGGAPTTPPLVRTRSQRHTT